MTIIEARSIAATATMPEIAATCRLCGDKLKLYKPTLSRPHAYRSCVRCASKAKAQRRSERFQAADDEKNKSSVHRLAKRDYWKAWRNVQRLPRVEVTK